MKYYLAVACGVLGHGQHLGRVQMQPLQHEPIVCQLSEANQREADRGLDQVALIGPGRGVLHPAEDVESLVVQPSL